ncbi:MAG: Ger(x)C family spore germination C-terminal domain-containing protein [Ethanoligenens sp.]
MGWPKLMLAVSLSAMVALTGCTTSRELKDMDIVEGLGVDLLPDGEYQATYQIFQMQTGAGGEAVDILQTSGSNLFDCSRNATVQTGKRLYYSNERVLVIGSAVCRKGLTPLMDFFSRNHELRMGQRVFMAEGRAADILTAKNANGVITAKNLEQVELNEIYNSKIMDMQLGEVMERISTKSDMIFMPTLIHRKYTPGGNIYNDAGSSPGAYPNKGSTSSSAGSVSSSSAGGSSSSDSGGGGGTGGGASSSGGGSSGDLQNKEVLEVERTAVFNQDVQFSGFMTPNQTRGFLWTRSGAVGGVLMLTMHNGMVAGVEVKDNSANLTVQPQTFTFDISFKTALGEIENSSVDVTTPAFEKEIIALQNNEVKHEIQSALDVAFYGAKSDIFRIGSNYFRFRPDQWRTLMNTWPMSGQNLKPIINVHSTFSLHD